MKKKTTDEFIKDAKKIYGDRYDYSKVIYNGNKTKVCIVCREHGDFYQTPDSHLRGRGCPLCGNIKRIKSQMLTLDEFIQRSKEIHKYKYDYTKVNYIDCKTKICIICPEHGEFWQTPDTHLRGCGCPKCGITKNTEKRSGNKVNFVKKAKEIHNNIYNYSKVDYINNHTKVCIICPEHGEFWMSPNNHTHKTRPQGCPKCNYSKLETEIKELLTFNNILFEEQKKFEWLGRQSLDFYLPDYNIAIECQGKQHFEPIEHFGGKQMLLYFKDRDYRKYTLCKTNCITILYYANYEYNFPYKVYTNKEELIKYIQNEENNIRDGH